MATHFSILARRIPWTEEPGRLQSTWAQRAGHVQVTNTLPIFGFVRLFIFFFLDNLIDVNGISLWYNVPDY